MNHINRYFQKIYYNMGYISANNCVENDLFQNDRYGMFRNNSSTEGNIDQIKSKVGETICKMYALDILFVC
jgi:hypothetical protein